jgi:hypothetical protein
MEGVKMDAQVKLYKLIVLIVVVLMLVLTFVFYYRNNVKNVPFWQFDASYIVIQLVSLFLVALFIERAVEVLIVVWRDKGKQEIQTSIDKERTKTELTATKGIRTISPEEEQAAEAYQNYKTETKGIAIPTAFVLGVIVSVAGFRILQPLADPAVFKSLRLSQQALFTCMDILITGALLGGGSKGIHEIIEAFLNTVEKYRENLKPK